MDSFGDTEDSIALALRRERKPRQGGEAPTGFDSDKGLSDLVALRVLHGQLLQLRFGAAILMPKVHDWDPEFPDAAKIDTMSEPTCTVARVGRIADAFRVNIERLRAMVYFPIYSAFWSGMIERAECIARSEHGFDLTDTSNATLSKTGDARLAAFRRVTSYRKNMTPAQQDDDAWGEGCAYMSVLVEGRFERREQLPDEDPIIGGVESILGSMILLGYAAYETLATDLWIEAVNTDASLAANWLEKGNEKQIKIAELAGFGFDLKNQMGTFLRKSEKVSFQSLESITAAYKDAFKGKADSCFEPFNELRLTSKVRHLLAHRGGTVDDQFMKVASKFPDFANCEIDRPIRLDGPKVAARLNPCIKSAERLLTFVDGWLAAKGS